MEPNFQHGTTTIGILCKDGVILAADRRASAGYMVANKHTKKLQQISKYIVITTAGLVSDIQLFTKLIKAQLSLLKIRRNKEPSVKEATNLLANIVYPSIRRPSMVQSIVGFLVGGWDPNGPHLYSIDPDGSITESKDYLVNGSGGHFALGVLEALYKKDITIEDGKKIALKAINAALRRDIATGNGVDIIAITSNGIKQIFEKEIDTGVKL